MKESREKIEIRPKLNASDEEIRGVMDFGHVLKKAGATKTGGFSFKLNLNSSLIIGGTLAISAYFLKSYFPSSTEIVEPMTANSLPIDSSTNLKNEKRIEVESNASEEKPSIAEPQTELTRKVLNRPVQSDTLSEFVSDLESEKNPSDSLDEVKPIVKPAEPIGGYPSFYEYFNRERKYPAEALRDSIQGVVTLKFLINTKGILSNMEVVRSLTKECDDEVIRLVKNMGPWNPAMINGVPVDYQVELPVTFVITKNK